VAEAVGEVTGKEKRAMATPEPDVYERLIDWWKQTWWGMPDTDEVLPLLKTHLNPEEAALLTGIPFQGRTLEQVADTCQMEAEQLRPRLDELARRGVLFRTVTPDTIRYSINDSMFVYFRSAFWRGDSDETTRAIAPLVNQAYYDGFFEQYDFTHLKGLRVLPVQGTIEDTRQIMPYEGVVKVLDSMDYFAVSHCACRHRKNLDPAFPDCEHSTEVCLHFGRLGRYTVENGLGREISRDEAEDVLRRSAEEGLVHGVSNWQEGIDTICNCCRCCCLFLEAFHVLKHSEGLGPSNYQVRTTPDACRGCGTCEDRCPMGAIQLEESPQARSRNGKMAVLNPDLCIGCGVCAYKCPSDSLVLVPRGEVQDPPKDAREYTRRVVADFTEGWARRREKDPAR